MPLKTNLLKGSGKFLESKRWHPYHFPCYASSLLEQPYVVLLHGFALENVEIKY
jgi:hypothetical protein